MKFSGFAGGIPGVGFLLTINIFLAIYTKFRPVFARQKNRPYVFVLVSVYLLTNTEGKHENRQSV